MSDTVTQRKIKRPGAGRTKGSNSFVLATAADLQRINPNPNIQWMVSRKQLEAMGATNLVTGKASELKQSVTVTPAGTAQQETLTDF